MRANDTLDPDSTAANTISITGTVTATGPAGTAINNGDATAVVSGNDIQVTLNGDFQQLALTETATVTVPYTLTGDAGDTSTANLVVTVNGANDVPIANDDTGCDERERRGDAVQRAVATTRSTSITPRSTTSPSAPSPPAARPATASPART